MLGIPHCYNRIVVLTDDADGADGTKLPTLRLLDSGGVIWTLPVRVDNRSAMFLVNLRLLDSDGVINPFLTSNIADLLSTLTDRVQITPPESSNLRVGSSIPSAPSASSVNTRMTVTDFGAVAKFSATKMIKTASLMLWLAST